MPHFKVTVQIEFTINAQNVSDAYSMALDIVKDLNDSSIMSRVSSGSVAIRSESPHVVGGVQPSRRKFMPNGPATGNGPDYTAIRS